MDIWSKKTKGLIKAFLFLHLLACVMLGASGVVPDLLERGFMARDSDRLLHFFNVLNPDIAVALAETQRKYQSHKHIDEDLLATSSLLRPGWPYYQLEILYAQIINREDKGLLQSTFDNVASLGKHERGIDVGIIPLSFMIWNDLREDQRGWIISRLNTARQSTALNLIQMSEHYGLKWHLCGKVSWNQVSRACR